MNDTIVREEPKRYSEALTANGVPHLFYETMEGNEEYEYFERLKALKVWDAQYEIISDNAGGNGNIPARYQDSYQNGSYELVLVFCDTEKKPYEQYEYIKRLSLKVRLMLTRRR